MGNGVVRIVGIGIDAVEVGRMRTILARTPSFAARVFTPRELVYARSARDPSERLAARFAAKEAVLKVLGRGIGACALTDIEIVRAESGAPTLDLTGAAARLSAEAEVVNWQLSMTHTDTMAIAIAIATT